MTAERWAKVPGWQFEASDLGKVRNLRTGRICSPSHFTKAKVGIGLTGSDADPAETGYFNRASVILSAFTDFDIYDAARPINGDMLDARLVNLEPDPMGRRTRRRADQGLAMLKPVVPAAAAQCRSALAQAGLSPDLIDTCLADQKERSVVGSWEAADRCIAALARAGLKTGTIADGLGLRSWAVTRRRKVSGVSSVRRTDDRPIDGEIWRHAPSYRCSVSNMGRVRGPRGMVQGSVCKTGRCRIKLNLTDGTSRTVARASLVLHVFRDLPLETSARHLNGDFLDCRLSNIEAGEREVLRPVRRKDKPWTPQQDRALRSVKTWSEGVRVTGHSLTYVKKRMTKLGIVLDERAGTRRGIAARPVEAAAGDRDLDVVQRAVAVLEEADIGDREINLGLRIVRHRKGEYAAKVQAVRTCAGALCRAGWRRGQIAVALGVAESTASLITRDLGLTGEQTPRPDGWTTKRGPAEERDGEEWRDIEHRPGYRVSNHGRVVNQHGHLLSLIHGPTGRPQVLLPDGAGRRTTHTVVSLVLAAFKPELRSRLARPLNGDPKDVSVANLVPIWTLEAQRRTEPEPTTRRGKNLADKAVGPVVGSVPYFEPLWVEARALCSPGMDPADREDLISETVLVYLDGRAPTIPEAFSMARRELNARMGAFRQRSLDAPIGTADGLSLMDCLGSDGELASGRQARRPRA